MSKTRSQEGQAEIAEAELVCHKENSGDLFELEGVCERELIHTATMPLRRAANPP